ncbi:MAG: TylF/MycF/NovP-related O-methyltransferase [Dehalococcoidia bacterium]
MALKLLEMPSEVEGVVLECGTWKGSSAADLSLVCKMTGRKLKIFDSFEGLPEPLPGDRRGPGYQRGDFSASLEEVQENIRKYGSIESCEFVQGRYDETMPKLQDPVVLAWLDVDLEASLETCVRYIWPCLVENGFIFTDEGVGTDYAALFWSEKWWKTHFDRTPPGLIGSGTGLGLGNYYLGPADHLESLPLWHAGTCAYTMKSMSGYWSYYPEEASSE